MDTSVDLDRLPTGQLTLTCRGSFTLLTRHLLLNAALHATQRAPRHLVVDLTRVTELDSGSLRLLDDLRQRVGPQVGWSLVCPDGRLRRALEGTDVVRRHRVHPDFGAAMTARPELV